MLSTMKTIQLGSQQPPTPSAGAVSPADLRLVRETQRALRDVGGADGLRGLAELAARVSSELDGADFEQLRALRANLAEAFAAFAKAPAKPKAKARGKTAD